ncbi:uncharacterized protein [Lolium perenne]|uniref:uncharacterized protein n=1 Tax=Lolium perenne TaxID=4522 RepID=UPI003A99029E
MAQVCPEWAEQHREAWEELIRARWLREDEEFAAVSRRNMENRGTGGTHSAGNRDYTRFKGKKVAEAAPGVVLHDAQIYDMMRTKQKPNPALPQPQYYGNAKAAKEDYCDMVLSRHPEVDDPLSMPTDEESLVLSGRGHRHGRYPFLNKAVKPSPATSYTRLKHTLTAGSPQPRPRPARPPAYDALMTSLSSGTPPPAQVPMARDMPIMPSRATFAMTYYGSTPVYAEGNAVGIEPCRDHMVRSMPRALPSA